MAIAMHGAAEPTYDYIVVGGGSSGCVVASRLSESGKHSVLLLEAGGSHRKLKFMIPAGVLQLHLDAGNDWAFPGTPDPTRNDRSDGWAAGKVLGGSGSINGMVWVRGHPGDFDEWARLGCDGWDYAGVLPHFKSAESYVSGGDDRFRGRTGPITIRKNRFNHALTAAFIASAQQLGYRLNDDYNGEAQDGVGYTQLNVRRGLRASAATAYLDPARRRTNLTVATGARVRRVLFRGSRATGVEYSQDGRTMSVQCRREVILSAGAIASPQLLLLSGIGPSAHLSEFGIPVVRDLPGVGANLADHTAVSLTYQVNVASFNRYFTPRRMLGSALQWALFRDGPLAAGPAHATLFAQAHASQPPDYLIHLLPFALPGLEKGRSVSKLVGGLMEFSGMTLVVLALHPRARGSIRLQSADPEAPPSIRHDQLAHQEDVDVLVAGAETARRLALAAPLRDYVVAELKPGQDVRSAHAWGDFLRDHTHRGLHPTGTCAMGSSERSVVDPNLRVRGVECLRVVDASIMPALPSGNSNAAAVMIGEHGAALLAEG